MAANDLEVMLRAQIQNNLDRQLNASVQAGDIQAARATAKQLQDLALASVKNTGKVPFTDADIRAAIKTKATWFGVDPRRSAKIVEFGKNMEPQSFKSAEEFADAVIKAVDEEFKTAKEPEDEPEDEEPEDEELEKKAAVRKKTDAPSGDTARAMPRRSSGPWAKLSDAPKEVADQIRSATDKFTRNATKEQREKYITTALATAYAADQRAKGRK
jgi:hypothetical protein